MVDRLLNPTDSRKRNKRVKFQRPKSADQIDLTLDANWIDVCQRWAEIKPTGGAEVLRGDQQVSISTHSVNVLYDELTRQLDPRCRILFGTQKLQIESIVNIDAANVELEIKCRTA